MQSPEVVVRFDVSCTSNQFFLKLREDTRVTQISLAALPGCESQGKISKALKLYTRKNFIPLHLEAEKKTAHS